MKKLPVIFLMGPTAAGKTDLAMHLTQKIPCEIISVDSAMIYRGMDIGTGKPNAEELIEAPHHLIDIRDPIEPYSAAEFAKDAHTLIAAIHQRGKIPILVGGTMLYFHALENGLSPLPSADQKVREKLEQEAIQYGWEAMHQRLAVVDPVAAARIHRNDPQRIQRALEVYEITGKPMTQYFDEQDNHNLIGLGNYHLLKFALLPQDRKILHQRIETRFHKMLEAGLIEEVNQLCKRGDLHQNLPSMRAVGYRQLMAYLNQEVSYNTMVENAVAATRQLAKRQLTWIRRLTNITYLDIQNNHLDSCETMIQSVP